MVKGWLKTSMAKEVRSSVRFARTARDIWLDLEERFGRTSAPRIYEFRSTVALLRQEKLSVSAFYTKIRSLWEELQAVFPVPTCKCSGCTCDLEKLVRESKENERVFDFLMGLDDVFSTVKSQILAMRPTPSLTEAYQLVANDEKQRSLATARRPNIDVAAFQAQSKQNNNGFQAQYKQNNNGFQAQYKQSNSKSQEDSTRPVCDHCHVIGHPI
ncbi:hypothetical protein LINGRAPRIM_LOCUS169 [Linum grandiflorum]